MLVLRRFSNQPVAEIVQCGEPIVSMSWRRRPIRDLNNSEQFRSAAIRREAGRPVELSLLKNSGRVRD
jgi:hypothetical protein